jgi:hypothetical protein
MLGIESFVIGFIHVNNICILLRNIGATVPSALFSPRCIHTMFYKIIKFYHLSKKEKKKKITYLPNF